MNDIEEIVKLLTQIPLLDCIPFSTKEDFNHNLTGGYYINTSAPALFVEQSYTSYSNYNMA